MWESAVGSYTALYCCQLVEPSRGDDPDWAVKRVQFVQMCSLEDLIVPLGSPHVGRMGCFAVIRVDDLTEAIQMTMSSIDARLL